jgi:hypothetical protein
MLSAPCSARVRYGLAAIDSFTLFMESAGVSGDEAAAAALAALAGGAQEASAKLNCARRWMAGNAP